MQRAAGQQPGVSPPFACNSKSGDVHHSHSGALVLTFGCRPPSGACAEWSARGHPSLTRPIGLTDGLVIQFSMKSKQFVAFTTARSDGDGSPETIYWGIATADEGAPTSSCAAENCLVPPLPGPAPNKAVNALARLLGTDPRNFKIRTKLGFDNVLMLAQLDRVYLGGKLPEDWQPCAPATLVDGQFLCADDAARLRTLSASLRKELDHLVLPSIAVAAAVAAAAAPSPRPLCPLSPAPNSQQSSAPSGTSQQSDPSANGTPWRTPSCSGVSLSDAAYATLPQPNARPPSGVMIRPSVQSHSSMPPPSYCSSKLWELDYGSRFAISPRTEARHPSAARDSCTASLAASKLPDPHVQDESGMCIAAQW